MCVCVCVCVCERERESLAALCVYSVCCFEPFHHCKVTCFLETFFYSHEDKDTFKKKSN